MLLYDYIKNNGPLNKKEAKQIAISICDLVEKLHSEDPPKCAPGINPRDFEIDENGISLLLSSERIIEFIPNKTYADRFGIGGVILKMPMAIYYPLDYQSFMSWEVY